MARSDQLEEVESAFALREAEDDVGLLALEADNVSGTELVGEREVPAHALPDDGAGLFVAVNHEFDQIMLLRTDGTSQEVDGGTDAGGAPLEVAMLESLRAIRLV